MIEIQFVLTFLSGILLATTYFLYLKERTLNLNLRTKYQTELQQLQSLNASLDVGFKDLIQTKKEVQELKLNLNLQKRK